MAMKDNKDTNNYLLYIVKLSLQPFAIDRHKEPSMLLRQDFSHIWF